MHQLQAYKLQAKEEAIRVRARKVLTIEATASNKKRLEELKRQRQDCIIIPIMDVGREKRKVKTIEFDQQTKKVTKMETLTTKIDQGKSNETIKTTATDHEETRTTISDNDGEENPEKASEIDEGKSNKEMIVEATTMIPKIGLKTSDATKTPTTN